MNNIVESKSSVIGNIFSEANSLSPDQIQSILDYQRSSGMRFGEAAVKLGFVKEQDVLSALARQFNYPLLAQASWPDLVAGTDPFCPFAEAMRDLRTSLLQAIPGSGRMRPIAFSSATPEAGTSFLLANLAVTFAQLRGRTLLVDANLRRPKLSQFFNVTSTSGLSGILAGRSEAEFIRPIPDFESLFLLPSGAIPPNPTELLQSGVLSDFMIQLEGKFDYVLVDCPTWAGHSDAKLIFQAVGAGALVVNRYKSKVADVQRAAVEAKRYAALFLGTVLNDRE